MVKVFPDKFPMGTYNYQKSDGYYMEKELKGNLDILKEAIANNWDGLLVVDGAEGSGKSVFTQQLAYYCDPTLNADRICFTPDEFKETVLNAEKFQAVVYDEAFLGLSSRKAMSDTNHSIVSMLTEIRQKNLYIFIVLPTYFDLDKYVAIWRSRALVHVYANKFERGYFGFYDFKGKKQMYVYGKKFYAYNRKYASFAGTFPDVYTVGKEEYTKKKLASLHKYNKSMESNKEATLHIWRNRYIMHLYRSNLKVPEITKFFEQNFKLEISERTIYHIIQHFE